VGSLLRGVFPAILKNIISDIAGVKLHYKICLKAFEIILETAAKLQGYYQAIGLISKYKILNFLPVNKRWSDVINLGRITRLIS
jgi:hypothetical protein